MCLFVVDLFTHFLVLIYLFTFLSLFLGTIKVTILPPVCTKGLTPDDVNDLTDKVRQQMLDSFHKEDSNINEEKEKLQ